MSTTSGQHTEWPDDLDIKALLKNGWRPTPLTEFILKVHGRCNLSCDYCYVYEAADDSWRHRPRHMSPAVIRATGMRIAEHAAKHALPEVDIVLHGGEPLLAGTAIIESVVREIRGAVPSTCRVDLSIQTNGILLNKRMLDVLATHDIGVSVSLDGDRAGHDRHRYYANGKGSHVAVIHGLNLLADQYRSLYGGLLCAIDLRNDPIRTYEALLETSPPLVDFLLPHGTWTAPPPGRPAEDGDSTPYADWLITVFDRWFHAPEKETGVRIFEEIISILLGGQSQSESVGLGPIAMLVIDTDGSLQQVDTLKTSYPGAPETGLTVFDHNFDEVLEHPGVVARQIGRSALSAKCMDCSVLDICGGGTYSHRYRAGHGYRNPSVYCADLLKLINHISRTVYASLAELRDSVRLQDNHNAVGSISHSSSSPRDAATTSGCA